MILYLYLAVLLVVSGFFVATKKPVFEWAVVFLLLLWFVFWIIAFTKECLRLKKLPDEWEYMSLKEDATKNKPKPNCPFCGEGRNVIENPFQDNDPDYLFCRRFWCISCDRKFNAQIK